MLGSRSQGIYTETGPFSFYSRYAFVLNKFWEEFDELLTLCGSFGGILVRYGTGGIAVGAMILSEIGTF